MMTSVSPGASEVECLVELWATRELAAGVVDELPDASGGGELVGLGVGVLVAGAHPGVADQRHAHDRRIKDRQFRFRDVVSGHELRDKSPPGRVPTEGRFSAYPNNSFAGRPPQLSAFGGLLASTKVIGVEVVALTKEFISRSTQAGVV